ncbi:heterokaryon incompatibility protein-domain-containing protein [Hyaloscypha finlandica]|nr:heterokaryon incompatibility protein-domain-containing protein [Hyaloscypha finlandica]
MATEPSESSCIGNDEQLEDSSNQVYRYTTLPTRRSIRLMELHASDTEDVIINLKTIELGSAPSYEAISYVWGDPNIKVTILCDGRSLKVTPNLKAALRHLRPRSGTRVLWADAACINQDDLDERSQQVSIMSTIYSTATRTLLWLRADGQESTETIAFIEKIGHLYCERNSITIADIRKLKNFRELEEFGIDKLRPFEASAWTKFYEFYDQTYFRRVWCIREVNVSKEVIVVYGQREIDFTLIALAAYWTTPHAEKEEATKYVRSNFGLANAQFMQEGDHEECSLSQLLALIRSFDCTDPRDKIYSTLDFGTSVRSGWIVPDYSKPVVDVFIEATQQMIKEDGMTFLSHIFHSSIILDSWPSWVPRWEGVEYMPLFAASYDATGADHTFSYQIVGNKLNLRGYCVDVVASVSGVLPWAGLNYTRKLKRRSLYDFWAENTVGKKASSSYPTGEQFRTAFSRTMAVGQQFDEVDFNAYSQKILESYNEQSERLAGEGKQDGDPFTYRLLARSASTRTFFETKSRYIGLGPKILKPDDQIWILLGSSIPIVLRPKGDSHQAVGSCYIHGYMHGESIKGLKAGTFVEQDIVLY